MVKRKFDDAGRLGAAADVDLKFEPGLGELGGDVAHRDRLCRAWANSCRW